MRARPCARGTSASSGEPDPPRPFGDALAARVAGASPRSCSGSTPIRRPCGRARAAERAQGSPAERAAAAVLAHCRALIDATAPGLRGGQAPAGLFRAAGARRAASALEAVLAHARERGLLVIADGKRGRHLGERRAPTRRRCSAAWRRPFGAVPGLGADLVTVNPLMGRDAIEPFVSAAREAGAGVLVLVRTSNPGAADVEDLELDDGGTRLGAACRDRAGLGGASARRGGPERRGRGRWRHGPAHLARARELMPRAPSCCPAWAPRAGGWRTSRPPSRRVARAVS